ncbi:MAG: hypothetical protein PHE27_02235 [Alphaproteobacteria bacterium]|nr:hypothetical protein [Alphaproteobacteria bacterium]
MLSFDDGPTATAMPDSSSNPGLTPMMPKSPNYPSMKNFHAANANYQSLATKKNYQKVASQENAKKMAGKMAEIVSEKAITVAAAGTGPLAPVIGKVGGKVVGKVAGKALEQNMETMKKFKNKLPGMKI